MKKISVLLILVLAFAIPMFAGAVDQEKVVEVARYVAKNGTPSLEETPYVFIKILEGDSTTVETRYYTTVYFTLTDRGLKPFAMYMSKEVWAKVDDKYIVQMTMIMDILFDGIADRGSLVRLVETLDGMVLEHERTPINPDVIEKVYSDLFYTIYSRISGLSL
jgi:hypothetical protein